MGVPIIRMHECGLPLVNQFEPGNLLWLIYTLDLLAEDWWEWASPTQWEFLTSP